MIEKPLHSCSEMGRLTQQPIFYAQEAVDQETGEELLIPTLVLQSGFAHVRVQVQFCPWCGALLPHAQTPRNKYAKELASYREYRKRYVKSEQSTPPLGFAEWQRTANEFDEVEFLLCYAKPKHTENLFRRKQTLRNRLALGVVLPKQEPPETAEDFVQKVRQWSEATPDFESNDDLEGMEPMV